MNFALLWLLYILWFCNFHGLVYLRTIIYCIYYCCCRILYACKAATSKNVNALVHIRYIKHTWPRETKWQVVMLDEGGWKLVIWEVQIWDEWKQKIYWVQKNLLRFIVLHRHLQLAQRTILGHNTTIHSSNGSELPIACHFNSLSHSLCCLWPPRLF